MNLSPAARQDAIAPLNRREVGARTAASPEGLLYNCPVLD
jgi:hypothetical protein